jgi:prepilin-type N-terminal cleavage/methylation domain-containing protein
MAMNRNLARAFTLIELLVVIAVIAILATIAYPVYTGVLERAKVTKDMSNLRQLGVATQTYMNDNDGYLPGSIVPPVTWMSQLNPKYLSAWRVLQSPFDGRAASEVGDATTPISYGINSNVYVNNVAISAQKITKPTAFILFAPAQASTASVSFQGTAVPPPPQGVTVLGIGATPPRATSNPGGNATGGTQNSRQRINALFADLHCETMAWSTFTNNAANASDPDGYLRWNPF